jgi:hypothetical protein
MTVRHRDSSPARRAVAVGLLALIVGLGGACGAGGTTPAHPASPVAAPTTTVPGTTPPSPPTVSLSPSTAPSSPATAGVPTVRLGPTSCAGAAPGCGQGPDTAADLAAGSWTSLPAAPLSIRAGETVVWTGSRLVVWGGAGYSQAQPGGAPQGDGAVWDPIADRWSAMAPAPLRGREGAAGVWDGHEVLVWGGDNAAASPTAYRAYADGAAYDPATNTWRSLPPAPLAARSGAVGLWTGTEAIIVAGRADPFTNRAPTSMAAFDPGSWSWRPLPDIPAAHGGDTFAVDALWTGQAVLAWTVTEIRTGTPQDSGASLVTTAWRWGPGRSAWQTMAGPGMDVGLDHASVVWTGARAVLAGGSDAFPDLPGPMQMRNPVSTYDPATGSWGQLPEQLDDAPIGLVWTGAALVSVGSGVRPASSMRPSFADNGGAAYDPVAGRWVSLPPFPLLSFEEGFVAWTGRALLVFGGGGLTGQGAVTGALLVPR